jgi:hypothetical protein
MNGGGLFETGAGGSAPKHVQQLVEGELPALGQPRRVPRAGRELRAPRRHHRQRPRQGAGRHARPGHRQFLRTTSRPGPQGRPARQPRQPLLPRALLGPGARRSRPPTPSWPATSPRSPRAHRQRGEDRRRAARRPGQARRHRRLLRCAIPRHVRLGAREREHQRKAGPRPAKRITPAPHPSVLRVLHTRQHADRRTRWQRGFKARWAPRTEVTEVRGSIPGLETGGSPPPAGEDCAEDESGGVLPKVPGALEVGPKGRRFS